MSSRLSRFVLPILACVLFLFPKSVSAQANIFISPASGTYKTGETFSILVNLNSGGQDINAATAQINFDNTRMDVVSLGYSRSIFSLWTEEPTFSNPAGVIRFSGGVPSPGFNGASGAILRATFRTKAAGSAPIVFASGSVLANDGKGTNIADALRGGLYTIIARGAEPAQTPAPVNKTPEPSAGEYESSFETSRAPIGAPVLSDLPSQLEEGHVIIVKGLGLPSSRIVISFQKDTQEPVLREAFAGPDGKFSLVYDAPTVSGVYRIWAKNVAPDGAVSDSSEPVIIEVVSPLFFRFGSLAIKYTSIVATLLSLLVFMALLLSWGWLVFRRWQIRKGKDVAGAEKTLHKSFDSLRDGLTEYVGYLAGAKTPKDIKRREKKVREEVSAGIDRVEKNLEKEIEDLEAEK